VCLLHCSCGRSSKLEGAPDPAPREAAPITPAAPSPSAALLPALLPALPHDEPATPAEIISRRGNAVALITQRGDNAAELSGGSAVDTASRNATVAAGDTAFGYAIYRFEDLLPEDLPGQLVLELGEARPASLYVALPDYSTGRWELHAFAAPAVSETLGLSGGLNVLSPAGNLYAAVLVEQGQEVTLDSVSLWLDSAAPPPHGFHLKPGTVNLVWEDPAVTYDPGMGEFVYDAVEIHAFVEGAWVKIGERLSGGTTFFKVSLTYAPQWFRLRTRVGHVTGPPTGAVLVQKPIAAVEQFAATDAAFDSRVDLSWNPVNEATQYRIYYRFADAEQAEYELLTASAGNSFSHTVQAPDSRELEPGTVYSYSIAAIVKGFDGPRSFDDGYAFKLGRPENVAATQDLVDMIVMTWDDVEHATGYDVFWKEVGTDPQFHMHKYVNVPYFEHMPVKPNAAYEYYVRCNGSPEESERVIGRSATALEAKLTATPNAGAPPLEVMLDATATLVDADQSAVSFEWDFEGDGTFDLNSGTDTTVAHYYTETGTFGPTVRVTQTGGEQSTASAPVLPGGWLHTWGSEFYEAVTASHSAVAVAPDGSLYFMGLQIVQEELYLYEVLLLKLTPQGELEWARRWEDSSGSHEPVGLAARDDGSVVLMLESYYAENDQFDRVHFNLLHVSPQGSLLAQRYWQPAGDTYNLDGAGFVSDGSACYLLCYGYFDGYLTSLLKVDSYLSPVWERTVPEVRPWLTLGLDELQRPVIGARSASDPLSARLIAFDPDGTLAEITALDFQPETEELAVTLRALQYGAGGALAMLADIGPSSGQPCQNIVASFSGGSLLWATTRPTDSRYNPTLRVDGSGGLIMLPDYGQLVRFSSSGQLEQSSATPGYFFDLDASGHVIIGGWTSGGTFEPGALPYETQPYVIQVETASDVTASPAAGVHGVLNGVLSEPPGAYDTSGGDGDDALMLKLPH
jgi:hypothetical protein